MNRHGLALSKRTTTGGWFNFNLFAFLMRMCFIAIFMSIDIQHCHAKNQESSTKAMCGTTPYPTDFDIPAATINSSQVWSFVSEPNLHPMKVMVNVSDTSKVGPGYIFTAPFTASSKSVMGQTGSLIMDNNGEPVWFRPLKTTSLVNFNFRVQQWGKKNVLTFWQGSVATPPAYTNLPEGSPEPGGCYYILDDTYKLITTISAVGQKKGFIADGHEFRITPQNTAYMLTSRVVGPMDLTPYGGPKKGYIQDSAVQEVDLNTNKLVFLWSAIDHIPINDTYNPASSANDSSNVWDVYHFNSIGLTDDPNEIIISSRNMWAVYRINKPTGKIVWKAGGKHSDFDFGKGAHFSWQHDARLLPNNVLTVFDDNCCEGNDIPNGTPPARGLHLKLNMGTQKPWTATRQSAYYHSPNINVPTMGNVQTLDNGNRFIGWGQEPYISEYTAKGNSVTKPSLNTVYSATMPGDNFSYRSFRSAWKATPFYPPSVVAWKQSSSVYVSWNGSTETAKWQVLAGKTIKSLSVVVTKPKTGFETVISLSNIDSLEYVQVKALDKTGQVIGESKVVKIQ